jgi:hypothetical protein
MGKPTELNVNPYLKHFELPYSSSPNKNVAVFQLNFPADKRFQYVAVKGGEDYLQAKILLAEALKRSKTKSSHAKPVAIVDGKSCHLPKTLQKLLSAHPFPVSQGPAVLSIDTYTFPKRQPMTVFKNKADFFHSHTSKYALWLPKVTGIAAWTGDDPRGIYSSQKFYCLPCQYS